MEQYIPEYKTIKRGDMSCLIRKLAPNERHYYRPEEYIYSDGAFWLYLDHELENNVIKCVTQMDLHAGVAGRVNCVTECNLSKII
ncbi:hypothetical protein V6615_16385 (plasmid) [Oscillospiraceae bacterium PP1C4]